MTEEERFQEYLAEARRNSERYRRSRDVRAPPLPPWFHKPAKGGQCRWCGKLDLPGKRRSWCSDDCLAIYFMVTGKAGAWWSDFILKKHDYACGACFTPLRCMRASAPHVIDPNDAKVKRLLGYRDFMPDGHRVKHDGARPWTRGPGIAREPDGPFSVLCREHWAINWQQIGGWFCPVDAGTIEYQVDHIVPLWSLDRSLPWDSLIHYWLPGNLWPLCTRCHKAKTKREARQRADLKRLDEKQGVFARA
jgi:hypothetical protein